MTPSDLALSPHPTRPSSAVLVAVLVPADVVRLLRGPGGGPLARLLGAGSRSELVAAALIRGLAAGDPGCRR